jgi:hypothetical protein
MSASSSRHTSTIGKATAARGRLAKSEFVSIGSPEETVLETYFVILSKMNFEKAREQCERERAVKSESGGGANWCDLITALSRLAVAESGYFSLSYMEKSWSDSWRRKREVGLNFVSCALSLSLFL